jgi:aldose 1-epimerase
LKVDLTYSLTETNSCVVHVKAETDSPTPFSFTQHSYFNLGGEECGSIEGHALEIIADEYVPAEENLTLSGRLETLDGRPNDFRYSKDLHSAIPQLFQSHGDLYRLRRTTARITDETQPLLAARLFHRGNGRLLEVLTTESYLQLYTGSALDGSFVGKTGHRYGPHAGLCLECHGYPDGANNPALGDILLRPGKPTEATTIYRFSIAD